MRVGTVFESSGRACCTASGIVPSKGRGRGDFNGIHRRGAEDTENGFLFLNNRKRIPCFNRSNGTPVHLFNNHR